MSYLPNLPASLREDVIFVHKSIIHFRRPNLQGKKPGSCRMLRYYTTSNWYPWRDSNPHCTGSKPVVTCQLYYTGIMKASGNWSLKNWAMGRIFTGSSADICRRKKLPRPDKMVNGDGTRTRMCLPKMGLAPIAHYGHTVRRFLLRKLSV